MLLTLYTDRLILRPFELEDAQAMFDGWASDPEVTKYLTWPAHTSVEITKRIVLHWVADYDKPERLNFAIVLKESGELIGGIDVVGYLDDRKTPVIGYNLARAHWGQGYMTEACRRVLAYLFEQGYEQVRIDAEVDNTASQRVIEKCGGIWFAVEEDERPLKGDRVWVNRYLVRPGQGPIERQHIWLGIDVEEPLQGIKPRLSAAERAAGIIHSNLTLPLHISLKISFPAAGERAKALVEMAEAYFRSLKPFEIEVAGVEYHETIAWIRMKENEALNRIHNELNDRLYRGFGIPLHAYDKDFLFHTTLCLDEDPSKARAVYEVFKDVALPAVLRARRFLIGASPDGSLGSYRVIRQVEAE